VKQKRSLLGSLTDGFHTSS